MAKMFAKSRKPEEIERYADVMQHVVAAGVNHPEIIPYTNGSTLYRTGAITLVLMRFVEGNTIKGDDGKIYIIDFSVANWYPRIQELAVMAANLLHEKNGLSLNSNC